MNFEYELKSKKLKVTPQRLAILSEIQSSGHTSVEDIYKKMKQVFPYISLATIYKNITLLHNANIVREIKAPKQKQLYELRDEHIHVTCEKCGKLDDIVVPTNDLRMQCESVSGYRLYNVSAVLIGICAQCNNEECVEIENKECAH